MNSSCNGMFRSNKWKYLLYYQNDEFDELIQKSILEMLYKSNIQLITKITIVK